MNFNNTGAVSMLVSLVAFVGLRCFGCILDFEHHFVSILGIYNMKGVIQNDDNFQVSLYSLVVIIRSTMYLVVFWLC